MTRSSMGLRLKFNLVLLTLVVAGVAVMMWADYRHEYATVMEAHAQHVTSIGNTVPTGPLDQRTLPSSVARRSLTMHLVYGLGIVVVFVVAVNLTVERLILRPAREIGGRIAALHRGQWRWTVTPSGGDELGLLNDGFQKLGPELDALVGQALRADRLATLALVSRRLEAEIDPQVRKIGEVAAQMISRGASQERTDGETLARAAAATLRAVHQFDAAFTPGSVRSSVLEPR